MDNRELLSRILELDSEMRSRTRELDSKLWELRDRFLWVWVAMFVGFYLAALFGLSLIHKAYVGSIHEMRRELMVKPSSSPHANAGNADVDPKTPE